MPERNSERVADFHSSDIQIHTQPLTLDQLQLKFDFRSGLNEQPGCLGIQLSAWHRQLMLASLIVMQQPGTTATLCCVQQNPLHTEPSSSDQQTLAINLLLNAAKQFAIDRQLATLQYLAPAGNCSEQEPDIRSALAQSGFRRATDIEQLSLAAPTKLTGEKPIAIQALPLSDFRSAADVLRQPWTNPLLRLLQAVLNSSQDLKTMPRPSALDLLLSWASMQTGVTMLVAKQPVDYAGLIVFSHHSMDNGAPGLTIEYVGTDPTMRGRRVASELVHATVVAGTHNSGSTGIPLTTFVDRDNTAARNLYQQCGLTLVGTHALWTCDVKATSKSLVAPPDSHSDHQESDRD